MKKYDRGSSFYILVEFKEYIPFEDSDYVDPSAATITITDPDDTDVVDGANILPNKSATGKYYYLVESLTTWITGDYKVTIESTEDSVDDVTVSNPEFQLV